MCECLAYAEGGMFLCEACAPMWEEYLASLGGKAVVVDSADAAAEPPGDLPPYPTASQMRAREEQVKQATREAKREAVGILKALDAAMGFGDCWDPGCPADRSSHLPACQAARAYIAAAEAEQEQP